MKPTPSADEPVLALASEILQRLHEDAPKDDFTLGWLMGTLHKRSFGIVLLFCAVVAVVPGVSIVAGVVLMVTAVQMIEGHPAPVFPARIARVRCPRGTSPPSCSDPCRCCAILSRSPIPGGLRRTRRPSASSASRS